MLDQPHGSLHDRSRAAVVGDEVDATQSGQSRREADHPAHVGEPPGIDRLVIVAHQEDVVLGRREDQGQLQLGPVQVLHLVHQQRPAARAPALEQERVGEKADQRSPYEIVEVQRALIGKPPLVGNEGRPVR